MSERLATVTYRLATGDDVAGLRAAHAASIRGLAAADYDAAVIDAWTSPLTSSQCDGYREALASGAEPTVVAESGGRIVGFAAVVVAAAELRAVYVVPEVARQGVGRELLRRVEALARAAGIERLTMDSSVTAEAFYLASGYESLGRSIHELKRTGGRMLCVRMAKSLPRP